MLSILIPVYNYNITSLCQILLKQLNNCDFDYEILISDDNSTKAETIIANEKLNLSPKCSFHTQTTNMGRTATRLNLAHKAKYKWLLFLDADVIPEKDDFMKNIFLNLNKNIDILFGGVKYQKSKPDQKLILRWKYGKEREAKTVSERLKKPYLSIISQNFLIKKNIFISISNQINTNIYGLDVLFSYELEKRKLIVSHINNPTIHLGLENNTSFISKSNEALKTIYDLQNQRKIPVDYRPIQKTYSYLKRYNLLFLYNFSYSLIKRSIQKNIYSKKPNLILFDLYRLDHFIKLHK